MSTYTVLMKNITLALDDKVLEAGRQYAERHQTTLNALVRELLARAVGPERSGAVTEMMRLMDAYPGHSGAARWTRDDLYVR